MFNRVLNLPFKVLGTVARAVQARDAEQWKNTAERDAEAAHSDASIELGVPDDFDPGPVRMTAAKALAVENPYIVDIGSAEDWTQGHAPHAVHIPSQEIGIRLSELPPDTTIILIARESTESERAVRFLRHRGLDDTWSLHGGLAAWKRAGGDVSQQG